MRSLQVRTLGDLSQSSDVVAPKLVVKPIEYKPICFYCKQKGKFRRVSSAAFSEGRSVSVPEMKQGKIIDVVYGICNICADDIRKNVSVV